MARASEGRLAISSCSKVEYANSERVNLEPEVHADIDKHSRSNMSMRLR